MKTPFVFLLLFSLIVSSLESLSLSQGKVRILYNSLDPLSISQHLAFYEIHRKTPEGNKAFNHALFLLTGRNNSSFHSLFQNSLLDVGIYEMVNLVNKSQMEALEILNENQLKLIESLGKRLANRKLKGFYAKNEREVLLLPSYEIDLGRGLLLSQFGETDQDLLKVRTYEALLDLMALQIAAHLPQHASPSQMIRAMNDFIFGEIGFRFPPHSAYAKDIDLYTFLPSVLDQRRGVCLGVSILYICIAQRLGLALEMVTPPGHIYVRYSDGNNETNIETTARGVHIESEEYLTVGTHTLQERSVKEVIGLAYYNQASVYLAQENYIKALAAYKKAEQYLNNDLHLQELMAYQYLLTGEEAEGIKLLKKVIELPDDFEISKDTMAEDYLNGKTDLAGIKAFFKTVDESRSSLLEKRDALQAVIKQYPFFRAGLFSLAATWLQLHRKGEALSILETYHLIEPNDPTAEYYLALLFAERMDYNQAWKHLCNAEKIVFARNHYPKVLKEIRRELSYLCPETLILPSNGPILR